MYTIERRMYLVIKRYKQIVDWIDFYQKISNIILTTTSSLCLFILLKMLDVDFDYLFNYGMNKVF